MKAKEWLNILEEFSDAFDDALEEIGFGELKNGNKDKILAGDSVTKERYLLVKEAEARILDKFSELKESREKLERLSENIVRWEKATGGEVIHRGYYNPSLVADIVIGRNGRGKLLIRPTKRSNITYEYGFDAEDRMVVAVTHTEFGDCFEYFEYEDDKIYGLSYDPDERLASVCEEVYEGSRIKELTLCHDYNIGRGICEVQHEFYHYSVEGYLSFCEFMEIRDLTYVKEKKESIRHMAFEFESDEEGYLLRHRVCYEYGSKYPPTPEDPWHEIREKRRILKPRSL